MKRIEDFRLEVNVRNNQIKSRREALGMTQDQLARHAGIPSSFLNGLETMRDRPVVEKGRRIGEWTTYATRLAHALKCSPDVLWPDVVLAVEKNRFSAEVSGLVMQQLAGTMVSAPLLPSEALEQKERNALVRAALDQLSPREREVIERRFGLGDHDAGSLSEVGDSIKNEVTGETGVTPECVRMVQARALRKLRHPGGIIVKNREEMEPEQ